MMCKETDNRIKKDLKFNKLAYSIWKKYTALRASIKTARYPDELVTPKNCKKIAPYSKLGPRCPSYKQKARTRIFF